MGSGTVKTKLKGKGEMTTSGLFENQTTRLSESSSSSSEDSDDESSSSGSGSSTSSSDDEQGKHKKTPQAH